MSKIKQDQQRLAVGTVVNLYTIDATGIGGAVHRFVPGARNGAVVTYQAQIYRPIPIEMEGIDYGGQGATSPRACPSVGSISLLWQCYLD